MGYRGQQNREDAERARYRAETPWARRVWDGAVGWAIVAALVAVAAGLLWWLR